MPRVGKIVTEYAVGQYASGEGSLLVRRHGWQRSDPAVIFANGAGYPASSSLLNGPYRWIVAGLAHAGLTVGTYDFGPDSLQWGNSTAMDRMDDAYDHLMARVDPDHVLLVGLSMGAQTVTNWVRERRDTVDIRAAAFLFPAVNTLEMANEIGGDFAADIYAAFGGEAGFLSAEPHWSAYNHPEVLAGIPSLVKYSTDDPVAMPGSALHFASVAGSRVVSLGAINHLPLYADYSDLAPWVAQYA